MLQLNEQTPVRLRTEINASKLLDYMVQKNQFPGEALHYFDYLNEEESIQLITKIKNEAAKLREQGVTENPIQKAVSQLLFSKSERFLSSIDQYINDFNLYAVEASGTQISISEERVKEFIEKRPYLFIVPEQRIVSVLKKEMELALESDVALYKRYKNKSLPIYDNPFQIIKIKLHKPSEAISSAINYLESLATSKTEKGIPSFFRKNITKVLLGGTKNALILSHRINMFFKENVDDSESRTKFFNYLIEHFWRIQVGRPIYLQGKMRADGTRNDDSIQFPEKGDETLRREGFYPINKVFEERFGSKVELVGHIAWSTLRAQILGRSQIKKEKPIVPLPKRRREGYWVVLETHIHKDTEFKKVHIPWEKVGAADATLEKFMQHLMSELSKHRPENSTTGPETNEEVTQALDEDIAYDSAKHRYNRKQKNNFYDADLRILLNETSSENTRITKAFSNIKMNPIGTRTPTVVSVNVREAGKNIVTSDITTTFAHAFLDGKEAEQEMGFILNDITRFNDSFRKNLNRFKELKKERPQVIEAFEELLVADTQQKIDSASLKLLVFLENEEEPLLKVIIKNLKDDFETFKRYINSYESMNSFKTDDTKNVVTTTALSTDEIKSINNISDERLGTTAYEVKIGSNIEEKGDETISNLYKFYSSEGFLYEKIKEKYGVLLNPYVIFNWALMRTLGISHVDFLEKDGEGLTPVPQKIPNELLQLLSVIERNNQNFIEKEFESGGSIIQVLDPHMSDEPLNQEHIGVVMQFIQEFNDMRFKKTRRQGITKKGEIIIGAGPAEVSKAAAGFLRKFITGAAKRLLPEASALINETFLVSIMTKSRKVLNQTTPDRHETRGFGTAADTVYTQGGFGLTNFGSTQGSVGWRGVLRAGKVDLVRKKFDTDSDNPKTDIELQTLFQESLLKNIDLINKLFLDICLD